MSNDSEINTVLGAPGEILSYSFHAKMKLTIPEKMHTPAQEKLKIPSPPLQTFHRGLSSPSGYLGFESPLSTWKSIIQFILGLNVETFLLINLSVHATTYSFSQSVTLRQTASRQQKFPLREKCGYFLE